MTPDPSFTLHSVNHVDRVCNPQLLVKTLQGQQFGIVVEEGGEWRLHGLVGSQVIGTASTLWGLFPIIEEYLTKPTYWVHSSGYYRA